MARAESHAALDILPPEQIDETLARRQLPPLLKGYLLAGAMVGDGAYLDPVFNTISVCVVMPTDQIRQRNRRRFQRAVRPAVLAAA